MIFLIWLFFKLSSHSISLERICKHYDVSRDSYYKHFKRYGRRIQRESEAVHIILAVRKRMPKIGIKKLYYWKKHQFKALGIGRDTLLRIARKNGLLKKRRRYVHTTQSKHRFRVYGNLLHDKLPTEADYILAADITYLKVNGKPAYLSLVMDIRRRMILGYALREDLSTTGPKQALQKALKQIPEKDCMIYHHSDRGFQYCSFEYQAELQKRTIMVSMSGKGNPTENAYIERLNGILKNELKLNSNFYSLKDAKNAVKQAIQIYNYERPHWSLNLMTPSEKARELL